MECRLDRQSVIALLPDIRFSVGFYAFKIDPMDLLQNCFESKIQGSSNMNEEVTCTFKIIHSEKQKTLGIPFFYSNLVIFDKSNKRIGKKLITRSIP